MAELKFESLELAPDRLYMKATGLVSTETLETLDAWTKEMQGKISEMHMSCGKPISCVLDISEIEQTKDPEVIAKLVEFQRSNKPHVYRTALIVKKPEVRLTMTIVAELAGRDNISSFAEEKDARAWAFGEK